MIAATAHLVELVSDVPKAEVLIAWAWFESAPDHFLRVILPLAVHFPVNCLPCPVK